MSSRLAYAAGSNKHLLTSQPNSSLLSQKFFPVKVRDTSGRKPWKKPFYTKLMQWSAPICSCQKKKSSNIQNPTFMRTILEMIFLFVEICQKKIFPFLLLSFYDDSFCHLPWKKPHQGVQPANGNPRSLLGRQGVVLRAQRQGAGNLGWFIGANGCISFFWSVYVCIYWYIYIYMYGLRSFLNSWTIQTKVCIYIYYICIKNTIYLLCIQFLDQNYIVLSLFWCIHTLCILPRLHTTYLPSSISSVFCLGAEFGLLKEGREVFPLTLGCCFHILRTDIDDVGWLDPWDLTWQWKTPAFEDVSPVENSFQCHVMLVFRGVDVEQKLIFGSFSTCFHHVFKSVQKYGWSSFLIFPIQKKTEIYLPQIPQRRKALRKFLTHYHLPSWIWADKKTSISQGLASIICQSLS